MIILFVVFSVFTFVLALVFAVALQDEPRIFPVKEQGIKQKSF